MGYESKIYLGLTFASGPVPHLSGVYALDEDGEPDLSAPYVRQAHYTQVVAMIDLSKSGGAVYDVIRKAIQAEKDRLATSTEDAPVYGYGLYISGDEFADRDPYDDPVTPLPLDDLIEALEVSYALERYRRYGLALALLKGWRDQQSAFGGAETTVVLHYGH